MKTRHSLPLMLPFLVNCILLTLHICYTLVEECTPSSGLGNSEQQTLEASPVAVAMPAALSTHDDMRTSRTTGARSCFLVALSTLIVQQTCHSYIAYVPGHTEPRLKLRPNQSRPSRPFDPYLRPSRWSASAPPNRVGN